MLHTSREPEVIVRSEATIQANLALDESLAREAGATGRCVLRLWWGSGPTAVLGCADKPEKCLRLDECRRRGVDWATRVTGGGAVLQTSEVFNYTLTAPDPNRVDIHRIFEWGGAYVIRALSKLGVRAERRGISDVAVDGRKISGSAQARKWKATLLHGTLIVDLDRELLEAVLKQPLKEPDYRAGRSHRDFVTTLADLGNSWSRDEVTQAFIAAIDGQPDLM